MQQVKALRPFSGANGSREKGEKFDYDAAKDPDRLIALGLVEKVGTAKK